MTSRTRSRVLESSYFGDPQRYVVDRTSYDCLQNPTVTNSYLSWTSNVLYETLITESMTDEITDNFYTRVNNGEIINNPLVHTIVSEIDSPCFIDFTTIGQRYECSPQCWHDRYKYHYHGRISSKTFISNEIYPLKDPINYDNKLKVAKELAAAEAWSNIDHSEVLALVSLAEAEKTLGTIRSISGKALRLLKLTRRKALRLIRTKRGRKKLFRELSDLYLEARYGLRPMYYDARSAISYYNKDRKKRDRYTFRGFHSFSGSDRDSSDCIYDQRSKTCTDTRLQIERSVSWDVQVRAGILTKLDLLTESKLLGLEEIPQSIWELVPFSFIIDWFLNVGDIIGTWSPKIGTSVLASWSTVKETIDQSAYVSGVSFLPYSEGSVTRQGNCFGSVAARYSKNTIKKTREPYLDKPFIPRFNVNLDAAKLLDLALICKSMRREKNEFHKSIAHCISTP